MRSQLLAETNPGGSVRLLEVELESSGVSSAYKKRYPQLDVVRLGTQSLLETARKVRSQGYRLIRLEVRNSAGEKTDEADRLAQTLLGDINQSSPVDWFYESDLNNSLFVVSVAFNKGGTGSKLELSRSGIVNRTSNSTEALDEVRSALAQVIA